MRQHRPRHTARRDTAGRFARRRAPAAAIIAHTVFLVIGDVSMARPEGLGNIAVIL